jgi:hypothetical protein
MKNLLVLAVLAALVLPAAAIADRPAKSPTPFPDFDVPAGLVCPFALHWASPVDNNFQIVHFDKSGDIGWVWGGGNNTARVTNLSNGDSVDLNATGPGKITLQSDGSVLIDGTGHWLVGYGPDDSPSSSLIYYSGHIVLHVAADGQLALVSYVGAAPQDVCSMIA